MQKLHFLLDSFEIWYATPSSVPVDVVEAVAYSRCAFSPNMGHVSQSLEFEDFFVFTFSTIFYKKKQNKTCSNMSQKLRVKPLSLSDNLQERLDTWLGRIRRVKRSKMATRKFCSTFFTIFEVFLLCFTHLSAREVKKCLSWLYLMLSWTYSVDRFGPEAMPDH